MTPLFIFDLDGTLTLTELAQWLVDLAERFKRHNA
jgi:phosphoserine phosphatase